MQTAYPLEHLYQAQFGRSEDGLDVLRQFFKTTLGVPDASWNHYLAEIRKLKSIGSEDFDWINDLYVSLDNIRRTLSEMDALKLKYGTHLDHFKQRANTSQKSVFRRALGLRQHGKHESLVHSWRMPLVQRHPD